jgi:hypothetical protein
MLFCRKPNVENVVSRDVDPMQSPLQKGALISINVLPAMWKGFTNWRNYWALSSQAAEYSSYGFPKPMNGRLRLMSVSLYRLHVLHPFLSGGCHRRCGEADAHRDRRGMHRDVNYAYRALPDGLHPV